MRRCLCFDPSMELTHLGGMVVTRPQDLLHVPKSTIKFSVHVAFQIIQIACSCLIELCNVAG